MSQDDSTLRSLREALKFSPENIPLRRHIAELLTTRGDYAAAEAEYRHAIKLAPQDPALKLGIARCYFQQDRNSEALVVVEDLLKQTSPPPPPECLILHARLLLRAGDSRGASHQYRKAIERAPELADETLAEQLGDAAPQSWREQDDDDQRLRVPVQEPGASPLVETERPKIGFADVGGMEPVKDEIRMKIIHPLTHPEIYKAYGKKIGGGILLYGPPGCGKTHLARATAGEVQATFVAIGIHDVLDMWIGSSEKNLHGIFQTARAAKPCILFFDEVDALGASRSDMRQTSGKTVINQFLSELDGANADNDGLLVLGATNAPWHLDSAFRRPGRFDRVIFVPPPDQAARAGIVRILLKGKPAEDVDHDYIAKKTEGFSGADLKAVIDRAVEEKLKDAMKRGVPQPLTSKDLAAAAKTVKPSTREWFATARNYALYSNEGGIYDEILHFLKMK